LHHFISSDRGRNLSGVHVDDFQVQLGDLIGPGRVGIVADEHRGECRDGPGGEDVGDDTSGASSHARIQATVCVASTESPPKAKKSSSTPSTSLLSAMATLPTTPVGKIDKKAISWQLQS
jgi:hypothetical protein